MAIERTFSIIKPDATARNLTGDINAIIERAGLRIVAQKRMRITREQAIRLYTINNAFLTFEEKEKGSLEPGKLADFIVLDRDILTCPVDEVRSIRVSQTYLGGKLVWNML